MTSPQIRQLARRLDSLEKQARQRKLPTLGHSSIDGGALQANDDDGNQTLIIGQQYDGTNTAAVVTGPPPPTPLLPLLTVQAGTLRIFWDGTFTDGDVAPMDFARVLAYAAPSAGFVAPDPLDHTQIVGQFTSATGGEITAALEPGVEYAVYLVAWTQAGKFGPASEVALGTPGSQPDGEAIEAALAEKSAVYRSATPPWENGDPEHAEDAGDMWFDTTLQPGVVQTVVTWSATGNVVTLDTSGEHGLTVGKTIAVSGIDETMDGMTHVVDSVPTPTSLTFSYVIADTVLTEVEATVQGLDVVPLNKPHMWDGTAWISIQDSGITDALTLVNGTAVKVSTHDQEIAQTQEELETLQNTANDAYNQAYAADGRVSISDYEPTGADVAGKQNGSLWITRTRDRTNASTNPSFEVDLTDWEVVGGTKARVPVAPAADGAYAMEITGGAGASYAVWDREGVREGCQPGQTITTSAYLRLVSGVGTGAYASLAFYDSLGVLISDLAGDGLPEVPVAVTADLDGSWQRVFARWAAPEGAASYEARFHNPNAGDVWQVDAHMAEISGLVGRYFDGDSEGGSWIDPDAEHLSPSILDGNAIIRLFTLEDSNWAEKFWTADTIISVNASTIDRGAMNGGFLADGTVPVDKAYMPSVVASEAIAAGSLVNIYNSSGVPTMRLATATDKMREANGFVLVEVPLAGSAPVYTSGYNPLMADLTPGNAFLSTAPGQASSTPPQDVGTIVQRVGNAVDDTTLDFAPTMTVALT